MSIYLAVEKRGMVNQLASWFGDTDVPILALGGFASQSYCDEIMRDVRRQERPAILLYAGDHDPPARTSSATSSPARTAGRSRAGSR